MPTAIRETPTLTYLQGILYIVLLYSIVGLASAYTLDIKVTDYYTSLPLDGVNVTLLDTADNVTTLDDDISNEDGWASVATTTQAYHIVYLRKDDYQDKSEAVPIFGDNETYTTMLPISYGIVRVIYDDLSAVGSDELLILMTDHDRILGKYDANDTIILGNSVNYTFKSRGTNTDALTNPNMIRRMIESNAFLFVIVLGIIGLFVGGLFVAAGLTSVGGA